MEELCLTACEDDDNALIDYACPTTVSYAPWVENFVASLPEEKKLLLKKEPNNYIYKFGGGEQRKSLGIITMPCILDNKIKVMIKTEIIQSDLPMLISNTTLNKGMGILNFGKNKLELLGKTLDLKNTKSGHFSMAIKVSHNVNTTKVKETVCLVMSTMERFRETEGQKLHHF